ncbi:MAG: T9SS type A sorting domain-containing protein [Bacteroidota bacterium]|nr:T9SS type A sorting domain-containing protein [Bacteroidota bacterium]
MKTSVLLFTKKKSFGLLAIPVMLLVCLLYILPDALQNEREAFESFIKSEVQQAGIPAAAEPDTKEKFADQPDMAAMQDYLVTMDPKLKMVPKHRLRTAYDYLMQLQDDQSVRGFGDNLLWEGTPTRMGGRMRGLMFDPNDPGGNKVWSGSVTGGLWYNIDITSLISSWEPVNNFWDDLSISCITYDPNNSQTFYVGTGEAPTAIITYRESSGIGMGVLKSTDGGETWSVLGSTEDFAYITDIAVRDENGSSVIYAGVVSGRYMGYQHQSVPSDGLYRSVDGGASWDQVLPNIPGTGTPYAPSDIEITSNGKIFVGTMQNLDQEGGAVILYSDHGLSGTWTAYEDIHDEILNEPEYNVPGRVILASAASDPNYIYGLIGSGETTYFTAYHCYHIVRTTDGGDNWDEVNTPPMVNNRNFAYISWHALAGGVDPNHPETLIVGGLDLWKSTNGGITWDDISDWSLMYSGGGTRYVHADHHLIVYKEGSSDEIICSTDGGVFYTSTGSYAQPSFSEKNEGLSTLQYYSCDIHPEAGNPNNIGGLQDNGTLLYQGETLDINDMITGGDGAYCFFDKDQPEICISSYYYNYYIFHEVTPGGIYSNYFDDFYYTGYFINPADYDSYNNTLYANGAYWSDYNQNTLLRITGIPDYPDGELLDINTSSDVAFSHVKFSPYSGSSSATLYMGSMSGLLYRITDANTSPVVEEIGDEDFPVATISCIALGGSEDTILVTFSNYGVSSIWQSHNGGDSWTEKEGNLPDMPVRWALYHPHNASNAMLATETGIWTTNDLLDNDVNWEPQNDGLANVRIDMLRLREADNTVIAATHGRGIYTAEYGYNPPTSVPELSDMDVRVYPNPVQDYVNISIGESISSKLNLRITDNTGRIIREETYSAIESGKRIQLNMASLPAGVYHLILANGDMQVSKKLVKL